MRRREFLGAGGLVLAGLVLPASADRGPRVRMLQDSASGFVGFDPVGLLIEPGTVVTWENGAGVHTVTAYHPANDRRPLRIPEQAWPWDSGYLLRSGETFAHCFLEPGVYDYCCVPHERAGMAGRIVVGTATGPGARPFDWHRAITVGRDWRSVPAPVRERLPAPVRIVQSGRVPAS